MNNQKRMVVLDRDDQGNLIEYEAISEEQNRNVYRIATEIFEGKMEEIGIDVKTPAGKLSLHDDMRYLRQKRMGWNDTVSAFRKSFVSVLVSAILMLIVMGAYAWLKNQK